MRHEENHEILGEFAESLNVFIRKGLMNPDSEYYTGSDNVPKPMYKDREEVPTTVMINPTWRKLSEETESEFEGCLSVPSIRGKVERYTSIEVTYYNENGEKVIKQLKGFTARDVQHECDHLDGIVFLERVKEHNGFATKEMTNKFNLKEESR